jgi:hypothetical protein
MNLSLWSIVSNPGHMLHKNAHVLKMENSKHIPAIWIPNVIPVYERDIWILDDALHVATLNEEQVLPSVIWRDALFWYFEKKLHRISGPAIICLRRKVATYVTNGSNREERQLTESEINEFLHGF